MVFMAVGGWLGWFMGGCDGLLYALIAFVVIDYLTGVMCAFVDHTLSSEVGFRGICRKVLIFLLVGMANILDVAVIGNGSVLRTAVIFFYISNEGVKGYFEFIQLERYRNLQGIRDPQEYLETIRADGYATSFSYVENCMKVIRQYELTRFDEGGCEAMAKTAESVLDVMRGWLGFSEANGKFKEIIDLYNSVKPLPRGYAVQYSDEWCDTCVSAAGIRAGCSELIGRECGVEEHVKIFKKLGIWIEDGTITPEPGYVIVYNWDKAAQPNDGYSDHIGFVEKVSGGKVTAIEGNRGEKVDRRVIPLGWGYIRGYAAPRYEKAVNGTGGNPGTGKKSVETVAKEVLAGKWGNGEDRKKKLQAAGYDYGAVQRKVNELMR